MSGAAAWLAGLGVSCETGQPPLPQSDEDDIMTRLLASSALVIFFGASPLPAQEWSDPQQDVLDAVIECWDLWVEAVEADSPDPWLDNCQTDDSTFWVGAEGSPTLNDAAFLRRNWGETVGIDVGWIDLRPIVIRVVDDFAVLHFYGYWQMPGEEPEIEEWRRTEVWRMDDGRWKQWAGHATPVN
jgi:hypothetical protein